MSTCDDPPNQRLRRKDYPEYANFGSGDVMFPLFRSQYTKIKKKLSNGPDKKEKTKTQ